MRFETSFRETAQTSQAFFFKEKKQACAAHRPEKKRPPLSHRLSVFHKNGTRALIHDHEIICIKGNKDYSYVYTSKFPGEELVAHHHLNHCAQMLPKDQFYRCHKSWIINLDRIANFVKGDKTVEMEGNYRPPVSDRKRAAFRAKIPPL